MSVKVYVVTGLNLGWDCIVGVFDPEVTSLVDLQKEFSSGEFVIFKRSITTLEEFQ